MCIRDSFTVDALGFSGEDFSFEAGTTEVLFDFSDMHNNTQYRVEYYWSTSSSWNGWFYPSDIHVDNSDNITDGHTFNITLMNTDCNVYFYVNLYNTTDDGLIQEGCIDLACDTIECRFGKYEVINMIYNEGCLFFSLLKRRFIFFL